MTDAKPYTKASQLARGPKRYRRKVASPKQWAAIHAEKCAGPVMCRVCLNSGFRVTLDAHHLVERTAPWFGDDVADNIIGLCRKCHEGVELREPANCRLMLTRLSDAEYAYAVGKAGENWAERIYGIEYER